jgi:hypothetical protein
MLEVIAPLFSLDQNIKESHLCTISMGYFFSNKTPIQA